MRQPCKDDTDGLASSSTFLVGPTTPGIDLAAWRRRRMASSRPSSRRALALRSPPHSHTLSCCSCCGRRTCQRQRPCDGSRKVVLGAGEPPRRAALMRVVPRPRGGHSSREMMQRPITERDRATSRRKLAAAPRARQRELGTLHPADSSGARRRRCAGYDPDPVSLGSRRTSLSGKSVSQVNN